MMTRRFRRSLALVLVCLQVAGAVSAAPMGGLVTHGTASIDTSTAGLTRIVQSTDRAIINWNGFSTSAGEAVRFEQIPGAAVLNRVTGTQASTLAGSLTANGTVFLLNPNGILFGAGSRTDVGGMVASTLSLSDADFLAGRYQLSQGATPLSSVVNRGHIGAADGGMVALVAPVVSNEGEIVAAMGRVVLGAGTQVTLSPDGAGLINLALPQGQAGEVAAAGEAAGTMLSAAVRQPRIVEGGDVVERGGRVFLTGAEGLALQAGVIDVSGKNGAPAGRVHVEGTRAAVLAPGSVTRADGTAGDAAGGNVLVRSEGIAVLAPTARLSARGAGTGAGGFVEVSGMDDVALEGEVDVASDTGAGGTLLIDPTTLTVLPGAINLLDPNELQTNPVFFGTGGAGARTIKEQFLESILTGTVILQAEQSITIADFAGGSLVLAPDVNLVLQTRGSTAGAITWQNAATLVSTTGAGTIRIEAGTDPTFATANDVVIGTLRSSGGAISVTSGVNGGSVTTGNVNAGAGTVTLTAPAGAIVGTAGRLIADTVVLRAITGIGTAAAPILTAALTLDAVSVVSGEVAINNDPAVPVTVTELHTGAGNVTFNQTGGGPLTVLSAYTGNGDIAISNTGTNLTVGSAVAAAGTGGVTLAVTGGDLLTTGQISGTGATGVTLTNTGGDVRSQGIVESIGGGVTYNATGEITTADLVRATGGALTLNATAGGIVTTGRLETAGANALTLTASTSVSIGGTVLSGAAVNMNATTSLVLDADLTAATTATLVAGGAMTSRGNITAGGAADLNSGGGADLVITGSIDAASTTLRGSGALFVDGRVGVATTATLISQAGRLDVDGLVDAGGAVTLTSAAEIDGRGLVSSDLSITVAGGSTVGGVTPLTFTAPGLDLSSGGAGDVIAHSVNSGATSVTLTQGTAGNIRLDHQGGGALNVAAATTAAGSIAIQSTGSNLTLTGVLAATGGNVTLETLLSGNVAVNAALNAAGSTVSVTAADVLTATGTLTAASLILNAREGIGGGANVNYLAGTLSAVNAVTGNVQLATTSAVATVVDRISAAGTGDVTFNQAGAGALTVGSIDAVNGTVTFSSAGASTVGSIDTVNGAVTLNHTAATTIDSIETVNGAITLTSTAATTLGRVATGTGAVALTATALRVNEVVGGGGTVGLTATAGALDVDALTARAGNVTLTSAGAGAAINLQDALVQAGSLTAGATTGDVNVLGDVTLDAGQTLTLTTTTSGIVRLAGNLTARQGTVNVTGVTGIQLVGASDFSGGAATFTSGAAIDGAGLVTAASVALTAVTGIGATTDLVLATDSIDATTQGGTIAIGSRLDRTVVVNASVTAAAGDIELTHSGAGTFNVNSATTQDGAVTLVSSTSDLVMGNGIGSAVTAGGAADVTARTVTGGNIVIAADVDATGDSILLDSAGSITGANLLTATFLTATARTAVGDLLIGLSSAASIISALAGDGGINITNTSAVDVQVDSLTAASGPIRFAQIGAGNVAFGTAGGNVITGAGDVFLSSQANLLTNNLITAGGAGSTASLTSTGGAIVGSATGRVTANTVLLSAAAGIGDPDVLNLDAAVIDAQNGATGAVALSNRHGTAVRARLSNAAATGGIALDQTGGGALAITSTSTANGAIDLRVSAGDLTIEDPLTAGGTGSIGLTTVGSGDIALGAILDATGDAVTLSAGGAITSAPGASAVANNLTATAGGSIDLAGLDVQTLAASGQGDVVVALTSAAAVNVTNLSAGGTGSVQLTQAGAGTLSLTNVTTADGDVQLTSTAGSITLASLLIAGGAGDVRITAGPAGDVQLTGTITAAGDDVAIAAGGQINGAGAITAADVTLTAGQGIGTAVTPLVLLADRFRARNGTGNVVLTSSLLTPVTVDALTVTGTGAITLTHTGGAPIGIGPVSAFNGAVTLLSTAGAMTTHAITAGGGAVQLTTNGAALTVDGPVNVASGTVTLTANAADLTVNGPVTVTGANGINLQTNGSGDIAIRGNLTADGDAVSVDSDGTLEGSGVISAASATLVAADSIGAVAPVRVNVATLSAMSTGQGDVNLDSFNANAVQVTTVSAAAGNITIQHAGGGLLSLGTIAALAGSIRASVTGGGLLIASAVTASGAGSVVYETATAGDVTLTGTTTAAGDGIAIRSAGNINGAGRLTAARVDLDAAAGIGAGIPLTVSAATLSADAAGAGGVAINSNLAGAVAVSSLTAAGAGSIAFAQTGGGAVSFARVHTADGNIGLSADSGRLVVDGPVTTGSSGNVLIQTVTGNVVIDGPITAPGSSVTIRSGGNITGTGLVTATSVTLTALFGMGTTAEPLNLAASFINASSLGNGSLILDNTLDDPVIVNLLAVGGTGDVQFEQRGGGGVTFGLVTVAAGSARLSNLSATPANLTLGTVVASADVDVTASSGEIVNGFGGTNVIANRVNFFAGRGIGSGAPITTAVRTITAEANDGRVAIVQGGPVDLLDIEASENIEIQNFSGDIRLGTLRSDRAILVTAAGSILTLDPSLVNLTTFGNADNRLSAGGVIGLDCSEAIRVNIDGTLTLAAGGSIDGISASIQGQIRPSGGLILATQPPGAVLFNCRIIPSELQQDADRGNPALVFQPFGFDLLSPYQTTPESRFETALRGLISTRDAWDDRWLEEVEWETRPEVADADVEEEAAPPQRRPAPARTRARLEQIAEAAEEEEAEPTGVFRRPRFVEPAPMPGAPRRTARAPLFEPVAQESDEPASRPSRSRFAAAPEVDEDAAPPPPRRPARSNPDDLVPSTRIARRKESRVEALRTAWKQHADARDDEETGTF